MQVYSLEVPKYAIPSFYKKDGVLRHIQDPKNDELKPTHRWNTQTKSLEKDHDQFHYDRVSIPWACYCHPSEVNEVVKQQLLPLKETMENCYSEEELKECSVFIAHTDLTVAPVYLGFGGTKGRGEKPWLPLFYPGMVLNQEETKKAQQTYLDSLKAKCRLQFLFGQKPFETYVILDDQVVGFLQEVSVHVQADKQLERQVEVAFPKLDDPTWAAAKEFAEYAKALESLGFVKVKYKELKAESPKPLEEVETVFASSSDEDFEKSLAMVRGQ